MTVLSGRKQDKNGNWGCCIDRHGAVFCEWWLHGHPFCNSGCTWDYPKDLPEASSSGKKGLGGEEE